MTREELLTALDVPFQFSERPPPLVAELRISWRLPIVLMAIRKCCMGQRTSVARLHVLSWASRDPENGATLLAVLGGQLNPTDVIVRFEPSLYRGIDLAKGMGLLTAPRGDRVQLTVPGARLADELDESEGLFSAQRKFFEVLGRSLTERRTKSLTEVFE